MNISDVADRTAVLDAVIAGSSRKVSDVAHELMHMNPTLAATPAGLAYKAVMNSAKVYVRGVLKSLSIKDLEYIDTFGGPVYCTPGEWAAGPVDLIMQDHPALHCKSNWVPSIEMYLTSYELLEHPMWLAEVKAELVDHAADVTNITQQYNKAGSRDWKKIIQTYKKGTQQAQP